MSAVLSLLRVMSLRDADAIVLEAGKIPTLRRRGQVESLAMPALDAEMLADFGRGLLAGRTLEGPLVVPFVDPDGAAYAITVEQVSAGLRLVARKSAKPSAPKPAPPPVAPPRTISAATEHAAVAAPAAEATSAAPVHASARADVIARLGHLLGPAVAIAREHNASDVVLSTGQAPRMRVEGRLELLDLHSDDAELAACVAGLGAGDAGAGADVGLELAGVRVRVNAFDHLGGYAVAARLIRDEVPGLAALGLPAELGPIVEHRDGLVLICGPTGSGKSTTLASLVAQLDERRAAHVITIEDPIEYRFRPQRCLIHQRELGMHVPSFAAGLRAALREAPDVIVLGELRDRETIAAALTAAETGHLVLATLHAPSAVGAIDRVIDAFPEPGQRQIRQQLASALRVIVTQYLLPRRDGGRVAAIELVPVTHAVANIIRKGDLHTLPTAIQSGREAGMIPLERSLARLAESGIVAPAAMRRIAADHDLLAALSTIAGVKDSRR